MFEKKNCYAIILAGGSGKRAGTILPKQFNEINGKANVELLLCANITQLKGDDFLKSVTIEDVNTKEKKTILYIFFISAMLVF